MQGIVFEFQRWCTHDGPGIRTVVFLKGCPLRCFWCCNPESQIKEPQIAIFPEKCLNCGFCVKICPNGAAAPAADGGFREGVPCIQCGRCAGACPSSAREQIGKYVNDDEVMKIIEKDRVFYRRSGGGVTFSGGEPIAQPEFLMSLVEKCINLGIHTAIETSGYFDWERNKNVVKKIDLVLIDIKHMNATIHKEVTGVSNKIILENASNISAEKIPMVVRIPLIPSINATPENIKATARFVRDNLSSALGVELLPYHRLGRVKYRALGLKYGLEGIKQPASRKIEFMKKIISNLSVKNIKF